MSDRDRCDSGSSAKLRGCACGSQRVVVKRKRLNNDRKLPTLRSWSCMLTRVGSIYITVCTSMEYA
jgi:hypothetical protein